VRFILHAGCFQFPSQHFSMGSISTSYWWGWSRSFAWSNQMDQRNEPSQCDKCRHLLHLGKKNVMDQFIRGNLTKSPHNFVSTSKFMLVDHQVFFLFLLMHLALNVLSWMKWYKPFFLKIKINLEGYAC